VPEFDADGNQLYIQTETGDWALNYNAANRPTDFSGMDEEGNFHTVKCDYDSMGRRVFKKVISGNGTVTSHHPPPQTLSAIARRACYACLPSQSGNAAEAGCDLTRTNHPALWLITWDPTQAVATRPLAIQKDGTWFTYGLDLTKNVCEIFGTSGYIATVYTYTPYGETYASGSIIQPIQWSCEFNDSELGLYYYSSRYYNHFSGNWISRDRMSEKHARHLYNYCNSSPIYRNDYLGYYTMLIHGTRMWGERIFDLGTSKNSPNGNL